MNVLTLESLRTIGWMYDDWKKGGTHMKEWMNKTQEFIDRAFSLLNNRGMKCPCSRCRSVDCEDKRTYTPLQGWFHARL
jgi:hypothetical protein